MRQNEGFTPARNYVSPQEQIQMDPRGWLVKTLLFIKFMEEKSVKYREDLLAHFSTEEGMPIPYSQMVDLIPIILSPQTRENNALGLEAFIDETFSEAVAANIRTIAEAVVLPGSVSRLKIAHPDTFPGEISKLVDEISTERPIAGFTDYTALNQEINEMELHNGVLSNEDRERLSGIFGEPLTPEDVAFAFYFAEKMFVTEGELYDLDKKYRQVQVIIPESFVNGFYNNVRVAKAFLSLFESEMLYTNFFLGDRDDLFEGMPILQAIIARRELDTMHVLSQNVNWLLAQGFFGDMSEELQEALLTVYEKKFKKEWKGLVLDARPDDICEYPYKSAKETAEEDKTKIFTKATEQAVANESDSATAFQDLLKMMPTIIKRLGILVHTVHEGEISYDIGSYTQGLLDIFLVFDGKAVCIQLDQQGRIYGVPEGVSEQTVQTVMRDVASKTITYTKSPNGLKVSPEPTTQRRPAAPLTGRPSQTAVPAVLVTPLVSQPPTEVISPKPLKRKARRRMGLEETVMKEYSIIAQQDTSSRQTIMYSENFQRELENMDPTNRKRVEKVITRLGESERLKVKKMINLSDKTNQKIYRIRAGDHRIIFRKRPNGTWEALKIVPRDEIDDVYSQISGQLQELLKRLA